ncbi:hypothetical protein CTZ27_31070 [Streptomyces griseocarneus]|nr:hypothetical protein CTZ27_31070 [Streptomyces griseocarneus]
MNVREPVPFDGDEVRWNSALRETARRYHATVADRPVLHAVVAELRLIRERTRHGWFRWEALPSEDPFGDASLGLLLREAGVLDPGQGLAGRWACRAVWGRQSPAYVLDVGGVDLPRPIPAIRAVVFTIATFAALVPATSVLPGIAGLVAAALAGAAVAQGVPAGLRQATRRRVRVVGDHTAHALVFFQLLAHEQQLRALARASGRDELARVAAMLPRLLWDAAGLVPLAEGDEQARELLLGYEESLAALVDQAAEVEREETAVESAILRDRPALAETTGTSALPDGLLPLASLTEARRELEELSQGLRHARDVLDDDSTGGSNSNARGDGHAR